MIEIPLIPKKMRIMLIISHSMTKVHLLKKSFLTLLMPSWKLNLTTILLLEEL